MPIITGRSRLIFVSPTVLYLLLLVSPPLLPPVRMLPIYGYHNHPVIYFQDIITLCDNICICPREAIYFQIYIGAGVKAFFAYEHPYKVFYNSVRGY